MKTGYILAAAVTAALSMSSCADLGFGVDVDSGGIGPYWNDYGPYGGPWNSPYWNYGPLYNGPIYNGPLYRPPVRPPFIDTNPGPVIRPPQSNENPGFNRVPTSVGGVSRPGNGGLPSTPIPSTPAQSSPVPTNNNARR